MPARHAFSRAFAAVALLTSFSALAQPRASKPIPAVKKAPVVDGKLDDFKGALALPKVEQGKTSFSARVLSHQATLYVGIEVNEDSLTPGDTLDVMLHFPGAGVTAEGHRFRFGIDGRRNAVGNFAAPHHAQERVKAGLFRGTGMMVFELAIPATSLPRFPAKEPLLFDLCITYEDRDEVGEEPVVASNCVHASMGKEALRLNEDFRKKLGLKPAAEVVGLQRRANGWIGYGLMHYPIWAYGDEPLTPDALERLVADDPVSPAAVGVSLPSELAIGKTRLFPVLSGRDPYAQEGKCDGEAELRLGLYTVKGRTADRVLEWPGSSCALGRASVTLDDDGDLTIGYSNGATVRFAWTGGKFQRTQIGRR